MRIHVKFIGRFENIKTLSVNDQTKLQSKISEAENSVNLIIESNTKRFKLQLSNSIEAVKSMKNHSEMNDRTPGDIYSSYMGHIQSDVQLSIEKIFNQ